MKKYNVRISIVNAQWEEADGEWQDEGWYVDEYEDLCEVALTFASPPVEDDFVPALLAIPDVAKQFEKGERYEKFSDDLTTFDEFDVDYDEHTFYCGESSRPLFYVTIHPRKEDQ